MSEEWISTQSSPPQGHRRTIFSVTKGLGILQRTRRRCSFLRVGSHATSLTSKGSISRCESSSSDGSAFSARSVWAPRLPRVPFFIPRLSRSRRPLHVPRRRDDLPSHHRDGDDHRRPREIHRGGFLEPSTRVPASPRKFPRRHRRRRAFKSRASRLSPDRCSCRAASAEAAIFHTSGVSFGATA